MGGIVSSVFGGGGKSKSTSSSKNEISVSPITNIDIDIDIPLDEVAEALKGNNKETIKLELIKIKLAQKNAKKEQFQNSLFIGQLDSLNSLIPFAIVVFLGYKIYTKGKK